MSATYDTVARAFTGANATLDVPISIGGGSNRVLVALIVMFDTNARTVSSITGGGTWSSVVTSGAGNGNVHTEIWKCIAPPTGAYTASLTLSGAVSSTLTMTVFSYADADQTAPVVNAGLATSGDLTITNPAGNEAVSIDADDNTNRTLSGCTSALVLDGFDGGNGFGAAHCTGSPSVFTWSGFATNSVAIGCSVVKAGGASVAAFVVTKQYLVS
jgi:hypothetical protein